MKENAWGLERLPEPGPKRPGGGGEDAPEEELYTVPRFRTSESGRSCYLLGRRLSSVTAKSRAVILEIRSMEGSLSLEVSGPFRLASEGASHPMDPGSPGTLGPLLARLGEGVARIRVDRSSNLRADFEDGTRLTVPGNAFRPSWDVQGAGDLEAVRPFLRREGVTPRP